MRDEPGGTQSRIAELTGRIAGSTARLQATLAVLTDDQAREPSLLPGWSRGHVLTHLGRNADGLRNLLIWARTGVVTPQYPSAQARDAAIEAGAGRAAADLVADLRESAAAFLAEAASMPEPGWQVSVHGIRGAGHPAWYTLQRRLSEVEIHHVDLAAGYLPEDWPAWFVRERLESVTADFAGRGDVPAALLRDTAAAGASATGSGEYRIGKAAADGEGIGLPGVTISGPGWLLLAWLIGRSAGAGLAADPAGPLPALPAW
ncbi:MAG: maleylpyruvate isomerase N-terminal domain-containing protein [Streptosporangiaceae bacterium]